METELMCDYSCFFFSPVFCFSLSSLAPCLLPSLSSIFSPLYNLAFCIFFRSVFCILFPPPVNSLSLSLSLSVPFCSLRLSLRSQWVWLRAECGVPPLSLAIKAMPTPRQRMSSLPSKRGGDLLIRSVVLLAITQPLLPTYLPTPMYRAVSQTLTFQGLPLTLTVYQWNRSIWFHLY